MRAKRLLLAAVTKANRHGVMADINDAVIGCSGWVVNHTLYANIATTFHAALPPGQVRVFIDTVEDLGVHLDQQSHATVTDFCNSLPQDEEVHVYLNVTFIHDEPDVKRDIPMVPG